jgi:glycosyltransferase involved in cell wall biosynthesis
MQYTLIFKNYNQWNEIDKCLKRWMESTIKPVEIIIMDDGSDEERHPPNCSVFRFPHTGNTSKMINYTVNHLNTEYFIITTPYLYPCKDYVEYLFRFDKMVEKSYIFGQMAKVNDYDATYDLVMDPPFYVKFNNSSINPPSICLFKKSEFLYFNEEFEGWGFEDSEYFLRWIHKGNNIYRSPNLLFYYVKHEHKGKYYENIQKNEAIFNRIKATLKVE